MRSLSGVNIDVRVVDSSPGERRRSSIGNVECLRGVGGKGRLGFGVTGGDRRTGRGSVGRGSVGRRSGGRVTIGFDRCGSRI